MANRYFNIDGSGGNNNIELLAPGDGVNNIKSILIVNTHDTADATVSLYIKNATTTTQTGNTWYLIKKIIIPAQVSLLLNDPTMLSFNNRGSDGYGLYLGVGSSDTINVIIH